MNKAMWELYKEGTLNGFWLGWACALILTCLWNLYGSGPGPHQGWSVLVGVFLVALCLISIDKRRWEFRDAEKREELARE